MTIDREDLASQPTICRMENAVNAPACYRMAEALAEVYIAQRGKDGVPQKVLLDFDATADPTHGDQEESYYHGYFAEHLYHPLVVFDGETGQLITALLRAGNAHASRSTVAILKRLVGLLRSAWPEVELRADAGFAVPEVYEYFYEGSRHRRAPMKSRRSGPGRLAGNTKASGRRVTRKAPSAHVEGGSGRSEASPTAILQDTHSVEGAFLEVRIAPVQQL